MSTTPERPAYLDAKPPTATVTQLPGTAPSSPPGKPRLTRGKGVDLERLEAEYRAGLLSMREIAAMHGISHGRVVQIAKEYGWLRDVAARARHRAAEILAQPELPPNPHVGQALDAATAAIVTVRKEHRKAISLQRGLVDVLVAETIALTHDKGLRRLIQEARAAASGDDDARLKAMEAAVERAAALSSRANVTKTLVDAQKTLIGLERQAYDLDAIADDPSGNRPPPDRSLTPAEMYRWMVRNRGKTTAAGQ